jgi:hypothetical protein
MRPHVAGAGQPRGAQSEERAMPGRQGRFCRDVPVVRKDPAGERWIRQQRAHGVRHRIGRKLRGNGFLFIRALRLGHRHDPRARGALRAHNRGNQKRGKKEESLHAADCITTKGTKVIEGREDGLNFFVLFDLFVVFVA